MLVEFSEKAELPNAIKEFYDICREENISFKRSSIPEYQVTYYFVSSRKSVYYQDVAMKEVPTDFEHAMTVIYMNHENESRIALPERPGVRTLLLREDLETRFSL